MGARNKPVIARLIKDVKEIYRQPRDSAAPSPRLQRVTFFISIN